MAATAFDVYSVAGTIFANSADLASLGAAEMEELSRLYFTPVVGASGALFGLLLAFGMLFPNTELMLLFLPIPIKAKYFVIGYGLIELYLGFQRFSGDNVAHFAHLGGMLFGVILLLLWKRDKQTFY